MPEYLKPGDTIGIVAPAHKISEEELSPAIDFLHQEGFEVILGDHLFASDNQYAGTDNQRTSDFQKMLDHPHVKAILCARGGYGSVRLVDKIDFSRWARKPKWICGYSDITVFHSHLFTHYQIPTLHCTMPINMTPENIDTETTRSMINALKGASLSYHSPKHALNRTGEARGKLIGGNLSILYALLGSASDINTDGALLFIEDVDEYLYHIDRMMMNMKRTGKLKKLSGLIVGGMSKMNDNKIPYGKNAEEIIREHCEEYEFPICFHFPAGHTRENQALRLGANSFLKVDQQGELAIAP